MGRPKGSKNKKKEVKKIDLEAVNDKLSQDVFDLNEEVDELIEELFRERVMRIALLNYICKVEDERE